MKKLKIDLSLGDSGEVLKDFEANSIDVLVTDPPYGLGEEPDPIDLLRAWIHEGHHSGSGRGFMGKCLHPKTEVLTSNGWKFIREVRIGDLLFSLNPDTHNAEFVPVSRTFEYDYEGTLSVIESLHTKQVVTPNHRVYIQSENDWDFCEANKLPSTFSVKNKNHVESLDQKAHVKKIVYSGKVYCCELQKNHIFLSKFDDKSVWTGNSWDAMVPGPALWKEVLRVLKPGAKGGVFAGTRTLHLMMASLRIAGFDIETVWSWTYGSGFPKSHNVYKALKKKLAKDGRYGEEGELRCECVSEDYVYDDSLFDPEAGPDRDRNQDRKIILDEYEDHDLTCRVCSWCLLPDDQYVESLDGLGTALKPAWEPVIVVQKPETNRKVDLEGILESYGFEPDEIELIMTPPEEDED